MLANRVARKIKDWENYITDANSLFETTTCDEIPAMTADAIEHVLGDSFLLGYPEEIDYKTHQIDRFIDEEIGYDRIRHLVFNDDSVLSYTLDGSKVWAWKNNTQLTRLGNERFNMLEDD